MVFIVFDSLGIKNHTFLHGVHGFSIPGNQKPYVFIWLSLFLNICDLIAQTNRTGPDQIGTDSSD